MRTGLKLPGMYRVLFYLKTVVITLDKIVSF